MIEGILSWVCLIMSVINENTDYLIASAIFAVAAQIELYRKGREKNGL